MPAFLFLAVLVANASADLPTRFEGVDLVQTKPVRIEVAAAPRATVIAFLSAKCPCSASHETELESLRTRYESQGFRFLALHANQDETAALAADHFRASSMKLPILRDEDAKIADAFGAFKTPHVFVLNPRGEILYQGGVDDSHQAAFAKRHYLADALAAILAGRRPEISQTRTLGCVISRK